jgi:hypothetical protein
MLDRLNDSDPSSYNNDSFHAYHWTIAESIPILLGLCINPVIFLLIPLLFRRRVPFQGYL